MEHFCGIVKTGQAMEVLLFMPSLFTKEKTINRVVLLDTSCIFPNPAQPRKVFEKEELIQLRDSIVANGLLQPLTVRRITDKLYELIAGERRLRACQMAEITQVPCIIVDVTEQQSAVYALIENIQRADLNFFEQALGIRTLMDEWGITQAQAAQKLGMAQSTVANKLRLLKLNPEQQHRIMEAGLTERHARALLRLEPEQREQVLTLMIEKQWNVIQADEYIDKVLEESQETEEKPKKFLVVKDVRIFFNTISKAIDVMKRSGIAAVATKHQKEDCIEYVVKIPLDCIEQK